MKTLLIVLIIVGTVLTSTAVYAIAANTLTPAQTTTITYTANGAGLPIPPVCALAKTVSSEGYQIGIYFQSAAKAGDAACMAFVVKNTNHTASPELSGISVTITDANGNMVGHDAGGCQITGQDTMFPVGTQFVCTTDWNTAAPVNGVTPQAGTYHLKVDVSFPATGTSDGL